MRIYQKGYPQRLNWLAFLIIGAFSCVSARTPDIYPLRGGHPIEQRPLIGNPGNGVGGLRVPDFGRVAQRRAKCLGCFVEVWIGPYGGEHTASVKAPPTSAHQPIARLINTGATDTEMYELKPATKTQYDLYFYSDNGIPTWEILPVNPANDGGHALRKGLVDSCKHPPAELDDADFWDCGPRAYQRATAQTGTLNRSFSNPLFFSGATAVALSLQVEYPGWFGCDGGCCTATAQ